jgi:hypothetical protein
MSVTIEVKTLVERVVCGRDVITVGDGLISSVYVFIDA